MSNDRRLIEAIKENFARKSSAQLRQILGSGDGERWSAEAFVAAGELLDERSAGRAAEPLVAEEEPLPEPPGHGIDSAALIAALNLVTLPAGFVVHPMTSRTADEDAVAGDHPIPFGQNMAWLALDTRDSELAAAALDLRETRPSTWAAGIDAARRSSIFVTPPVGDWTLAVGTALFPPGSPDVFPKPLLQRLSQQFGDAQYFCTHREVELHMWARARQGRLIRGHGWLGQQRCTFWDEGRPTPEEIELGLASAPAGASAAGAAPLAPDEQGVMQLALLWSIDPTSLDEHFKEPVMGLLGRLARAES